MEIRALDLVERGQLDVAGAVGHPERRRGVEVRTDVEQNIDRDVVRRKLDHAAQRRQAVVSSHALHGVSRVGQGPANCVVERRRQWLNAWHQLSQPGVDLAVVRRQHWGLTPCQSFDLLGHLQPFRRAAGPS